MKIVSDAISAGSSHKLQKTCRSFCSGLTLTELLVTLTIFSIIIGVAAPSFSGVINSNRVNTATASIADVLRFARAEAMRRGSWVSVSPVNTIPNVDNEWGEGVVAWADTDNDQQLDSDEVLRIVQTVGGGLQADVSGEASSVSFDSRGMTALANTLFVALCVAHDPAVGARISLLSSGIVDVQSIPCHNAS